MKYKEGDIFISDYGQPTRKTMFIITKVFQTGYKIYYLRGGGWLGQQHQKITAEIHGWILLSRIEDEE